MEAGQRIAKAFVGADEVTAANGGRIVGVVEALAAIGLRILRAQDAEHVGAAGILHAGDAGGPVGGVGLKLAGVEGFQPALALSHKVAHGVGLVAVGHDELVAQTAHGVVDDQAGVHHLAFVVSLGADAVVGGFKNAVAAVGAAAHDKVHAGLFARGGLAQHDAAAGVGALLEIIEEIGHCFLTPLQGGLPVFQSAAAAGSIRPAPSRAFAGSRGYRLA